MNLHVDYNLIQASVLFFNFIFNVSFNSIYFLGSSRAYASRCCPWRKWQCWRYSIHCWIHIIGKIYILGTFKWFQTFWLFIIFFLSMWLLLNLIEWTLYQHCFETGKQCLQGLDPWYLYYISLLLLFAFQVMNCFLNIYQNSFYIDCLYSNS